MGSDDSAKGPLAWWSAIVLNEHNVVDAKTSGSLSNHDDREDDDVK